jgi:hypothetical protein
MRIFTIACSLFLTVSAALGQDKVCRTLQQCLNFVKEPDCPSEGICLGGPVYAHKGYLLAKEFKKFGRTANLELLKLLRHKDIGVQFKAGLILSTSKKLHKEDLAAIRKTFVSYLNDEDWDLRASAAEALGLMGAKQEITKLATLVSDDDWLATLAAAESLTLQASEGLGGQLLASSGQACGQRRENCRTMEAAAFDVCRLGALCLDLV